MRKLFKSKAGDQFDIHRAIMTGWIAYQKVQPAKRPLKRFAEVQIPIIFRLHALAEASTGRAQTQLLAIIDNDMSRRVAPIPPRRKNSGHWASDFVKGANLLAYTIFTGSSHYLRDVIDERVPIARLTLKPLLQFAIPRWSVMTSQRGDAINFDAAVILRCHGENPLDEYEGRNAWRDAFTWIIDDPSAMKSTCVLQILTIIKLMVDPGIDLSKRRAMLDKGRTPAGAIRTFILEAICCSDARTETCACPAAHNVRVTAKSILQILDPLNETRQTHRQFQDRGRRPQSRGREHSAYDQAARMPLNPQTHKSTLR